MIILKEIRKSWIQKRAFYTEEARFSLSQEVCNHIVNWILLDREKKTDTNILLFFPFKNELDIFQLIKRPELGFCKFFLPRINSSLKGEMNFFKVDLVDLDKLQLNKYGIAEPSDQGIRWESLVRGVSPDVCQSLILVPALRISKNGYRLGYGGGYYDRFLQKNAEKLLSFGICYEKEFTPNLDWQIQAHDQKLNFVVTPLGIFKTEE